MPVALDRSRSALGYHTCNKPLYGFAKHHHLTDARIQRDLDMALATTRGRETRRAPCCAYGPAATHTRAPRRSGTTTRTKKRKKRPKLGTAPRFAARAAAGT